MKGIPIKFRGVVYCSCGEKVFGELTHQNGNAYIRAVDGEYHYRVDENTISQLVGYDADGNEVYEDDKLILGSHEYIAGIRLVSYTDDKKYYMPEKDFSGFLLKENKKMTEKILPLPVKKNKFGQRVADIFLEDYYHQIVEEILEAHEENLNDLQAMNDYEAEELVDVITTCITRLDIMHWYEDANFNVYVERIVTGAEIDYSKPKRDFYVELTHAAMLAYSAAKIGQVINILSSEGCAMCIGNIDSWEYDEESALANIIVMCITRLELLGYDESARQQLYQAVNEKNRKRGYFDD